MDHNAAAMRVGWDCQGCECRATAYIMGTRTDDKLRHGSLSDLVAGVSLVALMKSAHFCSH